MKKTALLSMIVAASFTAQAGMLDQVAAKAGALQGAGAKEALSSAGGLLGMLGGDLGLSPKQAAGGTAVLLKEAAAKMPSADYKELISKVPGLDQIAKQAQSLGSAGDTASALKSFGLNEGMLKQMAPKMVDYAKKFVSPKTVEALSGALKAFM